MVLNSLEKALQTFSEEGFASIVEAICACQDKTLRELMGNAMRGGMNFLRFPSSPDQHKAFSQCAHVIVTVPFTIRGKGNLDSMDALKVLCHGIDQQMNTLHDDQGAKLPGLVVAVPNKAIRPIDLVNLNFMLSNPSRKEADDEYLNQWWH